MARPPKDPAERKSHVLRIPVTEAQRKLIVDAANQESEDMATWARDVLLNTAKRKSKKDSNKPK